MEIQRQLLRVISKLMAFAGIGFFVYVFIFGLFGKNNYSQPKQLIVDGLSVLVGESKRISFSNRRLLILHLSSEMMLVLKQPNNDLYNSNVLASEQINQWRVFYATDPLFGCEVKWQKHEGFFESVCGAQKYDVAGRAYKNQQSQMNLNSPEYKVSGQKIIISD